MKTRTSNLLMSTILALVLLSLFACQKDIEISHSAEIETPAQQDPFYPTENMVIIDGDEHLMPSTSATLQTRSNGDIQDDVIIISGVDQSCPAGISTDSCIKFFLDKNRYKNDIDTGKRIGISSPLVLGKEGFSAGNRSSCYQFACNYINQENNHSLDIKNNGLYRVQMTSKSATRNLDLFVYKLNVANGVIDSSIIAAGILPAGCSETVNILQPGYYTLVVDDKTNNLVNSDYVISVSKKSLIISRSFIHPNRKIAYQFQYLGSRTVSILGIVGFINYNLSGWQIKQTGSPLIQRPVTYALNSTFQFNCFFCDYTVTPVFTSATGAKYLGESILIKP